jgi:succinoglycan biosynthesis protein ExoM
MNILLDKNEVIEGLSSYRTVCCSVCIATYRRPRLLEKLLVSLENQSLPDRVELEIIIVDNDSNKTARPIIQKFEESQRIRICYFTQTVKNISLTRNVAVEKASGDYILFIDDDEVASEKWVYYLLKTICQFNVDGAIGPVFPEFNPMTPKWMKRSDLFYLPVACTGQKAKVYYTSNCIFRADVLKEIEAPFDPRYGITGGEDTHLFARLEQQGACFVYCREGSVTEYLPPDRTCVSYLLKRALKGGNAHTRRIIEFAGSRKIFVRFFMVCKSLGLGSASLILMLSQCTSPLRRTKWLMKLASNIGRFLAAIGYHYQNYR